MCTHSNRLLQRGPQWYVSPRKTMTSTGASDLPNEEPLQITKENARKEERIYKTPRKQLTKCQY